MNRKIAQISPYVKWIISGIAFSFIFLHLVFPTWAIDSIVLWLLLLAFFPWILPLVKSIELPGGAKVDMNTTEEVEKTLIKTNQAFVNDNTNQEKVTIKSKLPSFDTDNPSIALAWIRIEMEKKLKKLAKSHELRPLRSITGTIKQLEQIEVLNTEEYRSLMDLIVILNKAIHSEELPQEAIDVALRLGPPLLQALEAKSYSQQSS